MCRYVRLASALMARSKWANVTRVISQSDMMMQMIDKSNERPKAAEHHKQQQLAPVDKKGKGPSTVYTEARQSSAQIHDDSDDDTLATDIWRSAASKKPTSGTKAAPAPAPATRAEARKREDKAALHGVEATTTKAVAYTNDDSDDDTAVSDLWKRRGKKEKGAATGGGERDAQSPKRVPGRVETIFSPGKSAEVPPRPPAADEEDAEDIGEGEGTFQEYMVSE
jgi:hypothetical protein